MGSEPPTKQTADPDFFTSKKNIISAKDDRARNPNRVNQSDQPDVIGSVSQSAVVPRSSTIKTPPARAIAVTKQKDITSVKHLGVNQTGPDVVQSAQESTGVPRSFNHAMAPATKKMISAVLRVNPFDPPDVVQSEPQSTVVHRSSTRQTAPVVRVTKMDNTNAMNSKATTSTSIEAEKTDRRPNIVQSQSQSTTVVPHSSTGGGDMFPASRKKKQKTDRTCSTVAPHSPLPHLLKPIPDIPLDRQGHWLTLLGHRPAVIDSDEMSMWLLEIMSVSDLSRPLCQNTRRSTSDSSDQDPPTPKATTQPPHLPASRTMAPCEDDNNDNNKEDPINRDDDDDDVDKHEEDDDGHEESSLDDNDDDSDDDDFEDDTDADDDYHLSDDSCDTMDRSLPSRKSPRLMERRTARATALHDPKKPKQKRQRKEDNATDIDREDETNIGDTTMA